MATVSSTPRTTIETVGAPSAGPFNVGFRLFSSDALTVYVNQILRTDFTVTASYVNGYTDSAQITFSAPLLTSEQLQIDGSMIPARAQDYIPTQPDLTKALNIELARLWATVSELAMQSGRSLRSIASIFNAGGNRITNVGAPSVSTDAARLGDIQNIVAAAGNVPSPTGGQVGSTLEATAPGVFGWVARAALSAIGALTPAANKLAYYTGAGAAAMTDLNALGRTRLAPTSTVSVTAGTNLQGQAPIAATVDFVVVTSTPNNPSAVTLSSTAIEGQRITVVNRGWNNLFVYPALGGTIASLAANAAFDVPPFTSLEFYARSATQWEVQRPAIYSDSFSPGTIVTALETIPSNNNDTTIPTSAAVYNLATGYGIGSIVMLRNNSTPGSVADVANGTTTSGSNLIACSVTGATASGSTTLSGSWQCRGACQIGPTATIPAIDSRRVTIWQRIS